MNDIIPISNIIISDDFRILVQDLNEKDFIVLKRDIESKVLTPKVKRHLGYCYELAKWLSNY